MNSGDSDDEATSASAAEQRANADADKTEESSCSEDEEDEAADQSFTDEWKRAHAAIWWRWHWLQLKINEGRHMMVQYDEQYQRKRRNKKVMASNYDTNKHCLRTVGMIKPKRRRKLCLIKKPTVPLWMLDRSSATSRALSTNNETLTDPTANAFISSANTGAIAASDATRVALHDTSHPLFRRSHLRDRHKSEPAAKVNAEDRPKDRPKPHTASSRSSSTAESAVMKYVRAAHKAQKVLVVKHADPRRIVITAQKPAKASSTSTSSASSSHTSSPKTDTKLLKPKPITPARRAVFAQKPAGAISHGRSSPSSHSSRSERPPRSVSSRHGGSSTRTTIPPTSVPAAAPSPSPSPTPAFKKQKVEPFNIDKLVLSCAVNSGYDMPAWMLRRDIATPCFKATEHDHYLGADPSFTEDSDFRNRRGSSLITWDPSKCEKQSSSDKTTEEDDDSHYSMLHANAEKEEKTRLKHILATMHKESGPSPTGAKPANTDTPPENTATSAMHVHIKREA